MRPSTFMAGKSYPPPGRCIYCLRGEHDAAIDEKGVRTDEHIIPYALNGSLVIKDAVCSVCQKVTGRPEQEALNSDLLVPRLLLELKRRRAKKKRQKSLPPVALGNLTYSDDLSAFSIELSAAQYPPIIQLLVVPPPGFLTGKLRPDGDLDGFQMVFCNLGIKSALPHTSVTTRSCHNFTAFFYLVTKIAYSYAIAELGFSSFDGHAIRELLLGKRVDMFNFVGGPYIQEGGSKSSLHRLSIRRRGDWVTVIVHLFSSTGVPPYEVVVGRSTAPVAFS